MYLQAATIIDPATDWVEIRVVPSARADLVAQQLELGLLTRYPLPETVILDRGNDFLAKFKTMVKKDYGLKINRITTRNPQANAILEHVHQTIGNIIHAMKIQEMVLDDENPWDGVLSATMFALCAMVNTTTCFTPTQLVFGRDAILNTRHEADCRITKTCKQRLINRGNERKNNNRKDNTYQVGEKVLLKNEWKTKFSQDAYKGPYTITAVRDNGTVRAHKGLVMDTYNLRNIIPYKE